MSAAMLNEAAVLRIARKRWRCVCADELIGYRVRGTYGRSWSESYATTLAEAEAKREKMASGPAAIHVDTGEPSAFYDSVEIIPRPNPNHREGCIETIEPGDRYVEYLGESAAWESGSRYCLPCGEAAWGVRP